MIARCPRDHWPRCTMPRRARRSHGCGPQAVSRRDRGRGWHFPSPASTPRAIRGQRRWCGPADPSRRRTGARPASPATGPAAPGSGVHRSARAARPPAIPSAGCRDRNGSVCRRPRGRRWSCGPYSCPRAAHPAEAARRYWCSWLGPARAARRRSRPAVVD